jgi:serine/threonine-protein kinase RsbW
MTGERLKIIFFATWQNLQLASDILCAVARRVTIDEQKVYHIEIVLSEAFENAFLHGNRDLHEKEIVFEMCFNQNKFVASVINKGEGFADKDIEWNEFPSCEEESGRGLKIIKRLCDKVEFKKIGPDKFGIFMEMSLSDKKTVKLAQ